MSKLHEKHIDKFFLFNLGQNFIYISDGLTQQYIEQKLQEWNLTESMCNAMVVRIWLRSQRRGFESWHPVKYWSYSLVYS